MSSRTVLRRVLPAVLVAVMVFTFFPPPTSPPASVATVTPPTLTQPVLATTAQADNGGITGYRTFRDGVQVPASITSTYSGTSLTAAPTYAYTMSAYDVEGNTSARSTSNFEATSEAPAGWIVNQNFDDDIVGGRPVGGMWGIVTNERAYSGANSVKFPIAAGDVGWGSWGGRITFPTDLLKGDEVWIRIRTFFPTGFNWDAGPGFLKFMRVATRAGDGSHIGFNDVAIVNGGNNNIPFLMSYEGNTSPEHYTHVGTLAENIQRGVWETYEWYLRFDDTPVESGGQGKMLFWKNGVLIGSGTERNTLRSATDKAESFLLHTWWNGGSPQTQHHYIDDFVMTNSTPGQIDAHGNPFIGVNDLAPLPATSPIPAHNATGVGVDADVSWIAGSGAVTHDVYFGATLPGTLGTARGSQVATTFDPGTLDPDTTYFWRVDSVNAHGTVPGAVWSFTTGAGSGSFVDDDGSFFEDYIERLYAAGVTRGCSLSPDARFCPGDVVTRGEMAAFLVRAMGLTDRGSIRFVDDNHSIFEADIEKLATARITQGCSAGPDPRFCPEDGVTRDQMAAFLVRAFRL